jgi:hypothetical protein
MPQKAGDCGPKDRSSNGLFPSETPMDLTQEMRIVPNASFIEDVSGLLSTTSH